MLRIKNLTRNKICLPKGLYLGLLREAEAETEQSSDAMKLAAITAKNNSVVVDIERIKIETSFESSDEGDERFADGSIAGPATAGVGSTVAAYSGAPTPSTCNMSVLDPGVQDLELMASRASEYLDHMDILKELSDQLTPAGDIGAGTDMPTCYCLHLKSLTIY